MLGHNDCGVVELVGQLEARHPLGRHALDLLGLGVELHIDSWLHEYWFPLLKLLNLFVLLKGGVPVRSPVRVLNFSESCHAYLAQVPITNANQINILDHIQSFLLSPAHLFVWLDLRAACGFFRARRSLKEFTCK